MKTKMKIIDDLDSPFMDSKKHRDEQEEKLEKFLQYCRSRQIFIKIRTPYTKN